MQGSKSCVGLVVLETRGPLTVYRELRVARYRNSFQSARELQSHKRGRHGRQPGWWKQSRNCRDG